MSTMEEANEFFESAEARENMRSTYREAVPELCAKPGCGLPITDLIHHADELAKRGRDKGIDVSDFGCHEFVAAVPASPVTAQAEKVLVIDDDTPLSRSVQKRIAAMKGEPAPTFGVAAPVTGPDVADAEGLWPEWKAIILASTKRGSLQEQSVPLSLVYDFADFVASRRAALIRTALEEQAAQLLADLENGRGNFDELQRKNYLLRKAESETRQLREALQPFADLASVEVLDHMDESHYGSGEFHIEAADIRRAKSVLAGGKSS
jgi:hypothetical protein